MSADSLVGAFGSMYNRTLLRGTLRLTDRIHVSNAAILDEFSFLSTHREKASVVPIGVDTEWFDPSAVSGAPPYQTSENEATVLFVGSFRRYKGLEYLVDAFADLLPERDARLVLVGDGARRPHVESRVATLGIEDAVELVGHVDDDALRRAYAHADAFVLPSPGMRESYGMVALEAMAMGVPTIVTEGSGIGRRLRDEDAGIVVEPHSSRALTDALRRVLDDSEYAAAKGDASRRTAIDEFAWRTLVDDYVDVYERLVGDSPGD